MNYQTLLESAQSLSAVERAMLISALTDLGDSISEKPPCPSLKELLNKQAVVRTVEESIIIATGKTKVRNASNARTVARRSPNIPALGKRDSIKRVGRQIHIDDVRREVFRQDFGRFIYQ